MPIVWKKYSGSDLEPRKSISRIFHSILQPMHGSGTQVYGERALAYLILCGFRLSVGFGAENPPSILKSALNKGGVFDMSGG